MEEKRASQLAPKIKPAPSLEDLGANDIAKVMKPAPTMEPVSMAASISTNEEVTTGIPTMPNMAVPSATFTAPRPTMLPQNDDAKVGKAFNVAQKTYKKFKLATIADFTALVDEIKNNL